jgi:hypothetical protein
MDGCVGGHSSTIIARISLGFCIGGRSEFNHPVPQSSPILGLEVDWLHSANLRDGDVVVSVDGMPLLERLQAGPLPTGKPLVVVYRRNGKLVRGIILIRGEESAEEFEPQPQPKPRREEPPPELAPFIDVIGANLKRVMVCIRQLAARGLSVAGVDAVITDLRKAGLDTEYLDKPALVRALHGMDRASRLFQQATQLVCNTDKGKAVPREDIESLTRVVRALVGCIHAVTCVVKAAGPPMEPQRLTEVVGFSTPPDAPPMGGNLNWPRTSAEPLGGQLTQQAAGTVPPRWGAPPYGGAMRWADTSGNSISWNESPDYPEYLEEALSPEAAEREIARLEPLLRKALQPHQSEWIEKRLADLRHDALGIPRPPRPSRRRPDQEPLFGRQLEQAAQTRLFWEIVDKYPGSVTSVEVPIAWDERGRPSEYRTVERVDPEVRKIALQGVEEVMLASDGSIAREMALDAIQARRQAERGPLWNAPNGVWAAHQRRSALDWAAPGPGEWDPWRR